MTFLITSILLVVLPLASAHFSIQNPFWRGDSFADDASQWIWPCANVSQINSADNRTAWPLTGGSLSIHTSHHWAPLYINVGMGNEPANFNISLLSQFNQTGNGTFCIRELGRAALQAAGVKAGDNATVQVIQTSTTGASLYNCADITFTDDAQLLAEDQCVNSTGVGGVALMNADEATQTQEENASATESAAESTSTGAAADLIQPIGTSILISSIITALCALGI